MSHFQEVLEAGEEGTILKASKGTWKDGKPVWQIKMKLEMDVDLRIIGFKYGGKGTKNEFVISSLICESSDGLVVTDPSGMKEAEMAKVTANQDSLLGTVVQVRCCGLSQDKHGNHALLHPSVVEFRDDKDTCDSLDSIREIENMVKTLIVE
jgi:ATP-dependent DNA ligase